MENIYIFMYASTKVLLILCFFGQKEYCTIMVERLYIKLKCNFIENNKKQLI